MAIQVSSTQLLQYLKRKSNAYYEKALELHDEVSRWLQYVPQTFPHYTRHTIEHSDAIITQLSHLLFQDKKPVVNLSSIEAYVLIAAALLHDSGMVTSDSEKTRILQSREWETWIGSNDIWPRIEKIRTFREGMEPGDSSLRHFLADIQFRFLIAEFVRRSHHLRASTVIESYQPELGRFAFDDPLLMATISAVCEAHGFDRFELQDDGRFPERRDIRGDKVNVRFMAILLRLGDLLDMDVDRACPLLLNAANPLPWDSLAHWTQYERLSHKMVAPDLIEIVAECMTQEEHRLLFDWCQWLVDEVREAAVVMPHAARHSEWRPPKVSLGTATSTIQVKPSKDATYVFAPWKFELDNQAVFERLIRDTYTEEHAFLRELIQNAADASRCRLQLFLEEEGIAVPTNLRDVQKHIRDRFPINITVGLAQRFNALAGTDQERTVIRVDDAGVGMDRQVVERYLLQVGRSYYTSDEFRRQFRFQASSRFGIGFLSVFAESDDVTIETLKYDAGNGGIPLRVRLTGPRSYITMEKGGRTSPGTSVEVVFSQPWTPGWLLHLAWGWCRRLEFPVFVTDHGQTTEIGAERPEQFIRSFPVEGHTGFTRSVGCYPIRTHTYEGELYVDTLSDGKTEVWRPAEKLRGWPQVSHSVQQRPRNLVCLNGIALKDSDGSIGKEFFSVRVDCRTSRKRVATSRESGLLVSDVLQDIEVGKEIAGVIAAHLKTVDLGSDERNLFYRQSIAAGIPIYEAYCGIAKLVEIVIAGEYQVVSAKSIETWKTIVFPMWIGRDIRGTGAMRMQIKEWSKMHEEVPVIIHPDELSTFSSVLSECRTARGLTRLGRIGERVVGFEWESEKKTRYILTQDYFADEKGIVTATFPNNKALGIDANSESDNQIVLNEAHPLTSWVIESADRLRNDELLRSTVRSSIVVLVGLDATVGVCESNLAHLREVAAANNLPQVGMSTIEEGALPSSLDMLP